jgi:hypothetical protein
MTGLVLQMCEAGMGFIDYLLNWQFFKAATCVYANPIGLLVVGMIFYGSVAVPIYLRQNSVVIPTVLLLLTGGAVMSQVAAPVTALVTIMLLMTGAGVLTYLYYKFS